LGNVDRSGPKDGFRLCEVSIVYQSDDDLADSYCLTIYRRPDTAFFDDRGIQIEGDTVGFENRIASMVVWRAPRGVTLHSAPKS
jgi:hypothetical protein